MDKTKPFERLDDRSRMNREVHVRFWEGLAVRFRWATQLPGFQSRPTVIVCTSMAWNPLCLVGSMRWAYSQV